jgi:hypothetical protein
MKYNYLIWYYDITLLYKLLIFSHNINPIIFDYYINMSNFVII